MKLELEMKSDNAVRSRKPAKTFKPLFRMLPVGRAYVEKAWPTMRSLDWTRAADTAKVLPMGFSIPRACLSASTVVLLMACGVQSEHGMRQTELGIALQGRVRHRDGSGLSHPKATSVSDRQPPHLNAPLGRATLPGHAT